MDSISDYLSLQHCHPWELYSENLDTELRQCAEEGKCISEYLPLAAQISAMPRGCAKEAAADELFRILVSIPVSEGYAFNEPSDLEGIKAARPVNRPIPVAVAKDDCLYDKIYGAWLGRVCGCLLGKPVEGMLTGALDSLLKAEGNYPLSRYIGSDLDIVKAHGLDINRCWAGYKLGYMPPDDDTNYTVMAAKKLIPEYGRDFTPLDMAKTWTSSQPISAYCTAERVAYKNFVNGVYPTESAVYKNPFREWIGAQIRADYFGYINPGNPELAAEMAWRDASISHVKNGIYGEMFVAAMLAEAAVCSDIKTVILAGLGEIPENCRLSADIKKILELYDNGSSQEDCFAAIHSQWNEAVGHDWCHTNSNAMIVAAALLYGRYDYGKSICMSVETGFDTDCNGATVGSILGMIHGAAKLPSEWINEVNDTVDTTITGCGMYKISDLAKTTLLHII